MALAARCPHCRALFRVIADQLKLRGGLVRCGECRKVFDAIGSLTYVDDEAMIRGPIEAPLAGTAHAGPQMPAGAATAPAVAAAAQAPAGAPAVQPPAPAPRPAPSPRPERDGAARPAVVEGTDAGAELGVPTLFRQEPDAAESSDRQAPLPAGESGFEAMAGDAGADDAAAPDFLLAGEKRRAHWIFGTACVPLVLIALAQAALTLRQPALEIWPSLRPVAIKACALYGCAVNWPAHPELLTIVASDLTSLPGTDVIELNASIRSRADFIMALPAIEVTLTDAQNRPVARKVFLPADYLASSSEPSSRLDEGLAPESDLAVRLVFEAQGLNVTGFLIYPFYV